MFFGQEVPSWHEIENRISHAMGFRTMGYGGESELSLTIRKVRSVKTAVERAKWESARILLQRFSDLDIGNILDELIDVVAQMAMIVVGSALTGGAIGAGIGAFAGGAGAVPGGITGSLIGIEVSGWILTILGLESLAEFFIKGLPRISDFYKRGIKIAWDGPRSDGGQSPFMQDDPFAQDRATHQIALGHVELVALLLAAIVEYLTRGRGNANMLAQEMKASSKGAHLGEWMLKQEDGLKKRPDLQAPDPHNSPFGPERNQSPANHSSGKDKEPPNPNPKKMPLHEVDCFKADNMPASKIEEFERQLKGQETGLNRLTVDEYLENIANPVKRNQAAARIARKNLQDKLEEDFQNDFPHLDALGAEEAAIKKARETMASLAGLHNPDLSAGGMDIIDDFGDRQVNSSIGAQWRPRIKNIKDFVEKIPKQMRSLTLLNVKLHKC